MEQDTSFTLLKEQLLTTQKVTVDLPQRPLEVLRWGSVLQGMGARGSFFKVVTQKITGTGFIASLWAMNDLSPSPSGIDSCLRPTTDDCWWKCQRPGDYWLGLQPSPSILPGSLQRPHPPQSSSAGLICTHLEVPISCSFATCFLFPEIYAKHTENSDIIYPSNNTVPIIS